MEIFVYFSAKLEGGTGLERETSNNIFILEEKPATKISFQEIFRFSWNFKIS